MSEENVNVSEENVNVSEENVNVSGENVNVYGGCVGPNSMYVKLIASDGHEFIINRKYISISTTLCNMLEGPFHSSEEDISRVDLKNIDSLILQKVCQYMTYKLKYTFLDGIGEVPDYPMAPEVACDLLIASNFLDI